MGLYFQLILLNTLLLTQVHVILCAPPPRSYADHNPDQSKNDESSPITTGRHTEGGKSQDGAYHQNVSSEDSTVTNRHRGGGRHNTSHNHQYSGSNHHHPRLVKRSYRYGQHHDVAAFFPFNRVGIALKQIHGPEEENYPQSAPLDNVIYDQEISDDENSSAEKRGFGDRMVIYGENKRGFGERTLHKKGFGERTLYKKGFGERTLHKKRGFGDRTLYKKGFGERTLYKKGFGERTLYKRGFGDRMLE